MPIYTTDQWVLLFFFYCFCGWMWESCYVSLRQRHWVNRGFLQGPLLPIYGSGAILILFVTLPVEDDLRLVWLLGMLAATVLEYLVGDAMERIFHVRYWDYSSQRWNLNGHICLTSSIAWGFFSILLVRYLHPPVGRLLARVPDWFVDPLAFLLTAAFTVDAVRSVQAALDLRELLKRLTEENEELRRLARRAEVAAAFAGDDLRRFREKTEVEKLVLQAELLERREAREERKARRHEALEAALRRRTDAKLRALSSIAEVLEKAGGEEEPLERLRARQASLLARTPRLFHRSARILRANPSAVAGKHREALDALRRLDRPVERTSKEEKR